MAISREEIVQMSTTANGGLVAGSKGVKIGDQIPPASDTTDAVAVIKAAIAAKEAAIQHYNKITKASDGQDYGTQDLCIKTADRVVLDGDEAIVDPGETELNINQIEILNATAGVLIVNGCWSVSTAIVLPVLQQPDRVFDWEAAVYVNRRF